MFLVVPALLDDRQFLPLLCLCDFSDTSVLPEVLSCCTSCLRTRQRLLLYLCVPGPSAVACVYPVGAQTNAALRLDTKLAGLHHHIYEHDHVLTRIPATSAYSFKKYCLLLLSSIAHEGKLD